jgi:glycosyltransferase involved in cell wall biosynthesis
MKEKYTLVWSFRNRFDVFKTSIETANMFTPKEVDFVLVDAASSDDTIKQLREYCNTITGRSIRICESSYRSSLSEAWNLGMMLTDSRYVIFSSSDVRFISNGWFEELKSHREKTEALYIMINSQHAVFLLDKKIIPLMGWFDEGFGIGAHFDCDYMIRASESGIKIENIPANGHWIHEGDHAGEALKRATTECPDRLPFNTLENEIYFKSKWESSWPGWQNDTDHPHHPPINIDQVTRVNPEIDSHPLYTAKCK